MDLNSSYFLTRTSGYRVSHLLKLAQLLRELPGVGGDEDLPSLFLL